MSIAFQDYKLTDIEVRIMIFGNKTNKKIN